MNKLLSFSRQLFFLFLIIFSSLQMQGENQTKFTKWTAKSLSTLKGKGTLSDPYLISSAEDFATFATAAYDGKSSFSGKYIKQTADISFNPNSQTDRGVSFDNLSEITYALPAGSKWGWTKDYFQGTYDGGGHSISGLYYSSSEISNIQWMGVFGGLKNAIVQNLTIKGSYFDLSSKSSIENSFGILAGHVENSTISNCKVTGCIVRVNNSETGTDIGALIGHVENGVRISKCDVSADIKCTASRAVNAGGIVGYCKVNRSSAKDFVNVQNCISHSVFIINPVLDRDVNGFMFSGFLNTNLSKDTEQKLSTVYINGCTNKMSMLVYTPTPKKENSKDYKVTGMNINSFANYVDVINQCADLSFLCFGDND